MTLTVHLPPDIELRLEALAARTGQSKDFHVTEAIREHIGDLEDLYIAEQRFIDIETGRTTTIPLEDLMKQHGLED